MAPELSSWGFVVAPAIASVILSAVFWLRLMRWFFDLLGIGPR